MIPWKLIIVLIVAILLALFVGFNLNNTCEISFIFGEIADVPVYFAILLSFVAGLAAALPFSFRRRSSKEKEKIAAAHSASSKAASENGAKNFEEGDGAASVTDKVLRTEKSKDGKK